jgi:nitric oxide dioxygenase
VSLFETCTKIVTDRQLGHQAQALASAVYAYAQNIEDLTPLLPVVERIAHKHASLHVIQDQYHLVGNHLIQALSDILGDAFTPQLKAAWCKAFWNLANVSVLSDDIG